MTYATDLGYKVGDKFRVLNTENNTGAEVGDTVTLASDDGSKYPFFNNTEGYPSRFYIVEYEAEVELISKPTRRKHYDLITAWAEGAEIEFYCMSDDKWKYIRNPSWGVDSTYRLAQKTVTVNGKNYLERDIVEKLTPHKG